MDGSLSLPSLLAPLAFAAAGLAMMIGRRRLAFRLLAIPLVGCITLPFVQAALSSLPAPLMALMAMVALPFVLVLVLLRLFGREAWQRAKGIILTRLVLVLVRLVARSWWVWLVLIAGAGAVVWSVAGQR